MHTVYNRTFYISRHILDLTFEEVGHVLQLRDVVFAVATFFPQKGEHGVELRTGVGREQLGELSEHLPP